MHKRLVFVISVTFTFFPQTWFAVPTAYAQTGRDILSLGMVVKGSTTFERSRQEDNDTITFSVNPSAAPSTVNVRLLSKYALDKAYVSSIWYRKLVGGGTVTIRLADIAPLAIGAEVRTDLLEGVLMCLPEPGGRRADMVIHLLRCLNFDEKARPESNEGRLIYEVDIFVLTPNQSAMDSFLVRHMLGTVFEERLVYARIEN